jgi:uncharacterized membrane protein YbhN (UPF0104 family)
MLLIYRGLGVEIPPTTVAFTYFLPYFLGVASTVPLGLGAFDLGMPHAVYALTPHSGTAVVAAPLAYRLLVTLPLILFGYASQILLTFNRRGEPRS